MIKIVKMIKIMEGLNALTVQLAPGVIDGDGDDQYCKENQD